MTSGSDIITMSVMLQYLLIAEILIFSICLMMLQIKKRAVFIWLCSNALALLDSLYTLQYIGFARESDSAVGAALFILSSILKVLGLAGQGLIRKSNRIPSIFLIISLILAIAIFVLVETDFRLFLLLVAGGFLSLSGILFALHNRSWTGLPALKYCVAVLWISALVCAFALSIGYPIGSVTKFVSLSGAISYQYVVLNVLLFFFHMAFIGLLVGRQARENMFTARKSVRIQQAISQSRASCI
jgi:hypothetical protein